MPFPTQSEYESLLYGLTNQHPQVQESTLRLYTVSVLSAIVEGELRLTNGLTLRVLEIINFKSRQIQKYSYTVLRGDEKIRWYDPQPHPEIESLKSTFPHHRHEPPNLKQNRLPAPGISFDAPNLETLIRDCVELGEALNPPTRS
ncbi:MAG: hypothetical protein BroJett039_07640 [Chloroflexota bacterium]|nr:MAG: hypothetical protein BroJett039_07640 [Chloroflexota bacterium]